MKQCIVVGGGPAGLMASRTLAQHNIDFLCIDKKKKIGLPLKCGEGIREKEFIDFFGHADYDFVENKISAHTFHYEDYKRTVHYNMLELNRPKFEQFLAKPIRKNIRMDTSCKDIIIKEDYIEIKTDKGNLKAKMAILAYGCDFGIQRRLKLINKKHMIIPGYGGIYKTKNMDKDNFHYYFDKDYFGYLWIFPKNNKTANIGFGALDSNPKDSLEKLLKKLNLNVKQISSYAGSISCSGPIEKTYADRLLVCGNAAGFVYAGSGEGIYFALQSGKIAAEIATEALKKNDFRSVFLSKYERAWKKNFGRSMEVGVIARDLLYLALKHNKAKELFNSPTDNEIIGMIHGELPLRAKLAWKMVKSLNLIKY